MRLSILTPLVALSMLAALTFWLAQGLAPGKLKGVDAIEHVPDVMVENFSARKLNIDGDVQFAVQAARLTHFADDDSSQLSEIRVTAFHPQRPPILANAPIGGLVRLPDGEDEVRLTGGVTVESEAYGRVPALHLSTPSMVIYPDRGLAKSNAGIKLISGQGEARAKSIDMDANSRRLSMTEFSATLSNPRSP